MGKAGNIGLHLLTHLGFSVCTVKDNFSASLEDHEIVELVEALRLELMDDSHYGDLLCDSDFLEKHT